MGLLEYFVLFGLLVANTSGKDFVPVLIWGNQEVDDSGAYVSGLSKLDTDDFFNYLVKKVKQNKPNIVVFVEENLSLEDFSWKDVNEQGAFPLLMNLTKQAEDIMFLPSVRNPYKAIKKLQNHGYSWRKYNGETELGDEGIIAAVKLREPDQLEGRPDLLRSHDEQISKIYNNLLMASSNVIGIYTGNHSSWIDADVKFGRSKREAQEAEEGEKEMPYESLLLMDNNRSVIVSLGGPLNYVESGENANLYDTVIIPTVERLKDAIVLDCNFKYKGEQRQVDFVFNGTEKSDWILSHVIVNENKGQILFPDIEIGAPQGYSYHCGRSVTFKSDKNETALVIDSFQIQPFVSNGKFGPAIDCIPYFSIEIWSGLFVVLILTLVLAWGIVMIMDINTMDRFDDAKGKTITISATD